MPALRSPLLAPSRQTARALPFPLAPVPAETTVCFLRRLAAANSVLLDAITSQIDFGPNPRLPKNADFVLTPSARNRLSVMTGRGPGALSVPCAPRPHPCRSERRFARGRERAPARQPRSAWTRGPGRRGSGRRRLRAAAPRSGRGRVLRIGEGAS